MASACKLVQKVFPYQNLINFDKVILQWDSIDTDSGLNVPVQLSTVLEWQYSKPGLMSHRKNKLKYSIKCAFELYMRRPIK